MNADAKIKDTRIANAAAHWGPRFTVNGVDFSDFKDVTGSLSELGRLVQRLVGARAQHEARGRAALAHAAALSARAIICCAPRSLITSPNICSCRTWRRCKTAHGKAVECLTHALPFMDPPGERVLIPYEGKHLAGVLRKPRDVDKPPIVLMTMGFDSTKEELVTFQQTFLDRGMAILAFDGPGQGEAEYDFAIRPDYENVVGPVIDWLEAKRPDVDIKRLGIWGISLGGYYAPRSAAFEKRIKAAIANCGPYNWGALWDKLPELTRAAYRRAQPQRERQPKRARKRFGLSLEGVGAKIECPIFVIAARPRPAVPAPGRAAARGEVEGPVELLVIEDGNHVAHNRPYSYRRSRPTGWRSNWAQEA